MTIGQASELEREVHLSPLLPKKVFPIHESRCCIRCWWTASGRVKGEDQLVLDPALARASRNSEWLTPLTVEIMHDNKVTAHGTHDAMGAATRSSDLEHSSGCAGTEAGSHEGFDAFLEQWRRGWPLACLPGRHLARA